MPWLLWLGLLGTSGAVGYFLLPKVVPNRLFDSFDRRLSGDLCRVAAPTTKDNLTKVRGLPERDAAITSTIPKGEKLLELVRQDVFVQIERQNGSKGWVFNNQIDGCRGVSLKPSESPKPSAARSEPPLERRSTSSPPAQPPTSAGSPSPTVSPSATISPSIAPTVSTPTEAATPTPSAISPAPSTVSPTPSAATPTATTAAPVSPSAVSPTSSP